MENREQAGSCFFLMSGVAGLQDILLHIAAIQSLEFQMQHEPLTVNVLVCAQATNILEAEALLTSSG